MATSNERNIEHGKGHLGMNTPPVVSPEAWEAARQQMLVKEKAFTRARDALAAERRRMPWMAVEKSYESRGRRARFAYKWWNWHDNYAAEASPDPKWVAVSDVGEAAFRKRHAEDPNPA